MSKTRMAVLLSGSGRTLQNFLGRIEEGTLEADIVVVVASSERAYGLERARRAGLPAEVVDVRRQEPEEYSKAITRILLDHRTDLVAMAGFNHLYRIPDAFRWKVLNIHPALIPAFCGKGFYGERVHRAVLEAGVKVSGCTVHFADNDYDSGPIILQRCVPVTFEDTLETLAARVFEQECIAYPDAVNLFAQGRLHVEGRRVRILGHP